MIVILYKIIINVNFIQYILKTSLSYLDENFNTFNSILMNYNEMCSLYTTFIMDMNSSNIFRKI